MPRVLYIFPPLSSKTLSWCVGFASHGTPSPCPLASSNYTGGQRPLFAQRARENERQPQVTCALPLGQPRQRIGAESRGTEEGHLAVQRERDRGPQGLQLVSQVLKNEIEMHFYSIAPPCV